MSKQIMFKNDNSHIAIVNDNLYILTNKYVDYSPRAIMIIPGFQVEIGRSICEIIEALKKTRLPIIIKLVTEKKRASYYSIVRMRTGNVDDKVVANIYCLDGKIKSISFNRALLKDSNYRRYNKVSIFHQISMPYELSESNCRTRRDQVIKLMSGILPLVNKVDVVEDGNQLSAKVNEDEQQIVFKFISNNSNNKRYELISISGE